MRIAWLAPSGWTEGFSAQTTVNVFKQALYDARWFLPYTNIRLRVVEGGTNRQKGFRLKTLLLIVNSRAGARSTTRSPRVPCQALYRTDGSLGARRELSLDLSRRAGQWSRLCWSHYSCRLLENHLCTPGTALTQVNAEKFLKGWQEN
ncbi:hypothetical protein RRG08_010238 [Elysia crispata]|uniref:Uncharacterized protein n=1 Tax=Elysia crispata TaxID=231223 RepID=A0AAE0Z1M9_9GAST|nr:hypothetical protein RRG08_010238 [Elysia crispata]